MPDASPITRSAVSPLLARAGKNYALARPILDLRDGQPKQPSKLNDAIKKLYQAKLKYEAKAWDEIISMGQLVSLYCNGNFLLQKNPRSAGYYVRPLGDSERQTSMNIIGVYRHFCVSKIMATNPNVRLSAADDDPRSIAAAQAARPMIDYWESQFYTARYNWRLALHKLNNGTSITRIRWNPLLPGPTTQRKETGEQETQFGEGYGECLDCDYEGPAGEFQNPELTFGGQCPQCQSNAVDVTAAEKQNLSQVTSGEQVNMGAPEITLLPLAACRWDLAKDAEASSWFITRHRIKVGDVKLLIGDAILPDTESSDDRSLEILHSLAYAGQPFEGGSTANSGRTHDKQPTACEFWVSPEDYADIPVEGGKTIDGDDLPAGKMSDVFKEPICIVGLNDMSLQIGIYAEKHCEQIVTGQWLVDADSGAGRGIQDAAATQRRYNRVDGHVDQGFAATATPTVLIDKRFLDDDQSGYLFKPATTIKLNLTQLPPGAKLQDSLYVPPPGRVNPQYIEYGQRHLMDMFQLQTLSLEFSDNIMNIDPKTLGGSQLASNLANSLYGPVGAVIGGERVRIAEIVYMLNCKHDPVGRYYPGKDGMRGRVVSSKDLKQGSLTFDLDTDSVIPTTPWSKQQSWTRFLATAGGVEAIDYGMKAIPGVMREMAARFNVKLEAADSDTISILCLKRLQQLEENFSAGVVDPDELIANLNPPPSVVEDKHKDKRDWWSAWLDLPEGQDADIVLRTVAEKMYWLHLTYESEKNNPESAAKGLTLGIGQAAAAAPMALGQAQLQSAQQENMPQDTSGQDQAMEAEAGRQAEKEKLEMQHGHEVGQTQSEQSHEKQMKKMEITSAEKQAKLNAQAKAKQAKAAPKKK